MTHMLRRSGIHNVRSAEDPLMLRITSTCSSLTYVLLGARTVCLSDHQPRVYTGLQLSESTPISSDVCRLLSNCSKAILRLHHTSRLSHSLACRHQLHAASHHCTMASSSSSSIDRLYELLTHVLSQNNLKQYAPRQTSCVYSIHVAVERAI